MATVTHAADMRARIAELVAESRYLDESVSRYARTISGAALEDLLFTALDLVYREHHLSAGERTRFEGIVREWVRRVPQIFSEQAAKSAKLRSDAQSGRDRADADRSLSGL